MSSIKSSAWELKDYDSLGHHPCSLLPARPPDFQSIPSSHGSEISPHPRYYGNLAMATTDPPYARRSLRRVERMAQIVRPVHARVAARIGQVQHRATCCPCIPRCITRFVPSSVVLCRIMLMMRLWSRNLAYQHGPHEPTLRHRRTYGRQAGASREGNGRNSPRRDAPPAKASSGG